MIRVRRTKRPATVENDSKLRPLTNKGECLEEEEQPFAAPFKNVGCASAAMIFTTTDSDRKVRIV
jgi:hypothetical protein